VLGETLDGILVDEAPESDEMFLQEIVARIIRTEGHLGYLQETEETLIIIFIHIW